MNKLIILLIVIIGFASAVPARMEPEPAAQEPFGGQPECALARRSHSECKRRAKTFCGSAVTSKFTNCRRVFARFCEKPVAVPDVESCLRARCDTIPGDRWHDKQEQKETCRKGCAKQCLAQVCGAPEPKPEGGAVLPIAGEEPVERECVLRPRSARDCDRASRRVCGDCVTSKCKACRRVFNQFCEKPKAVRSVESCLAERCARSKTMKSSKHVAKCRAALVEQCKSHMCGGAVLPIAGEEPVEGECVLPVRSARECDQSARRVCGDCVTSKCKACRKVYNQFCEKPKAVRSVESCLAERCARSKTMKSDKHVAKCRAGLRSLCASQVCNKQQEQPAVVVRPPAPVVRPPQPRPATLRTARQVAALPARPQVQVSIDLESVVNTLVDAKLRKFKKSLEKEEAEKVKEVEEKIEDVEDEVEEENEVPEAPEVEVPEAPEQKEEKPEEKKEEECVDPCPTCEKISEMKLKAAALNAKLALAMEKLRDKLPREEKK